MGLSKNCAKRQYFNSCSKIFKLKIKFHPVNADLYLGFKHHISFATDLAANFGCYRSRTITDRVSKLLHTALASEAAI